MYCPTLRKIKVFHFESFSLNFHWISVNLRERRRVFPLFMSFTKNSFGTFDIFGVSLHFSLNFPLTSIQRLTFQCQQLPLLQRRKSFSLYFAQKTQITLLIIQYFASPSDCLEDWCSSEHSWKRFFSLTWIFHSFVNFSYIWMWGMTTNVVDVVTRKVYRVIFCVLCF